MHRGQSTCLFSELSFPICPKGTGEVLVNRVIMVKGAHGIQMLLV